MKFQEFSEFISGYLSLKSGSSGAEFWGWGRDRGGGGDLGEGCGRCGTSSQCDKLHLRVRYVFTSV